MTNPHDCKFCRTSCNGGENPCVSLWEAKDCPWMSRSDWDAIDAALALSPQDGRAAIDFCGWLSGYLAGCAGKDELTAFEANTIRNTLNEMVFPRGVPTASS